MKKLIIAAGAALALGAAPAAASATEAPAEPLYVLTAWEAFDVPPAHFAVPQAYFVSKETDSQDLGQLDAVLPPCGIFQIDLYMNSAQTDLVLSAPLEGPGWPNPEDFPTHHGISVPGGEYKFVDTRDLCAPPPSPSETRTTNGEDAPTCTAEGGGLVTQWSRTEEASYVGNGRDGWTIGSWFEIAATSSQRPATPEECPTPVAETPAPTPPATTTPAPVPDSDRAVADGTRLASTGADDWGIPAFAALVLMTIGGGLLIVRRIARKD